MKLFSMLLSLILLVFASVASADYDASYIYKLNEDGQTITIIGLSEELTSGQDLVIPSTIDGKTVTAISGAIGNTEPFMSTAQYGTLTLPNTVTTLTDFTFNGFAGTLTIPSSVTSISGETSGDQIEKIIVNANVNGIPSPAFRSCYNLREITFAEGISYIDYHCFAYCNKLERVYLPDSMNSVRLGFLKNDLVTFYLKRFETEYPYGEIRYKGWHH